MRLLVASLLALSPLAAQELPQPERVEQPVPTAPTTPRAPPKTIRVVGTAAALDRAGVSHPRESGIVRLYHPVDGLVEAEVKEGRFEALVSSAEKVILLEAELAGRSIEFEREEFDPTSEAPIAIAGRWVEPLVLHVVDDATGDELEGVEVRRRSFAESTGLHAVMHEAKAPAAPLLSSPLRLTHLANYLIRAPGRAWMPYLWTDGDRTNDELRLPRACTLVVETAELDPAAPVALCVQHEAFEVEGLRIPPAEVAMRVELDSLPPGTAVVVAGLDFDGKPWAGHFVELGRTRVELAPDAPARVHFELPALPAGLHPDGTVDRVGFVTLPGVTDRRRFTGDGEFTYVPTVRLSDANFQGEDGTNPFEIFGEYTSTLRRADVSIAAAFEPLRSPIRGGRFEVRVPYGCRLALQSLRLDDREYEADEERFAEESEAKWSFDTKPDPIEIAVPAGARPIGAPLDLLLHVVDRETKGELTRVTIADPSRCGTWYRHPGSRAGDGLLLEEAQSPLRPPLPRGGLEQHGWVGAEGYAWSPFAFDAHGEETIELERGADLAIVFEGARPPDGSVVTVRLVEDVDAAVASYAKWYEHAGVDPAVDGVPSVEEARRHASEWLASLREGTADRTRLDGHDLLIEEPFPDEPRLAFSGVPRGGTVVCVEFGANRECLAWKFVDASHGGSHEVQVHVPDVAVPVPVPLRGTLELPVAWGIEEPRLTLRPRTVPFVRSLHERALPRKEVRADAQQPGRFHWDAGTLLPGTWTIGVEVSGWRASIALVAPGFENVELVVPPPATCIIHLVDETTGGAAKLKELRWGAGADWNDGGNPWQKCSAPDPMELTDRFEFLAPIGPVEISAWDEAFAWCSETVTLRPGRNEFTLKLRRRSGIVLRLVAGEESFDLSDSMEGVDVTTLGGADVDVQYEFDDERLEIDCPGPGRFRVTIPRIAGYRAVAPIEVDVKPGEFTEVAITLVPEDDSGDRDR